MDAGEPQDDNEGGASTLTHVSRVGSTPLYLRDPDRDVSMHLVEYGSSDKDETVQPPPAEVDAPGIPDEGVE
jgi:hypothetical protein